MQFQQDGEKVYVIGDDGLPLATMTLEDNDLVVKTDHGEEKVTLKKTLSISQED